MDEQLDFSCLEEFATFTDSQPSIEVDHPIQSTEQFVETMSIGAPETELDLLHQIMDSAGVQRHDVPPVSNDALQLIQEMNDQLPTELVEAHSVRTEITKDILKEEFKRLRRRQMAYDTYLQLFVNKYREIEAKMKSMDRHAHRLAFWDEELKASMRNIENIIDKM